MLMSVRASEPEEHTCPICVTRADSDAAYFARAFGGPRVIEASGEALADAFGYCRRHGAALVAREGQAADGAEAGAVREALAIAVPRILLLADETWLYEPQVQQALFGADGACPACAVTGRAVGRQAAGLARRLSRSGEGQDQAERLCAPHFQAVAACLAPEQRLAALAVRAERMDRAVRQARALLRGVRESDDWTAGEAHEALNDVLGLVIGRPTDQIQLPPPDGLLAEALTKFDTLTEAKACPDVCPICVETERARRRWLDQVQAAVGFDEDAWLHLPTCPEHVAEIARLCQPVLTTAAVARTLAVTLRYQRRQIRALQLAAAHEEEVARIKAEGPDAWAAHKRKRRKRDRQQSDEPKLPPPRLTACPACDRAEIAVEHATGRLLDLLHDKKRRDAFAEGYGLCLKHFARAYRIAPGGVVRTLLAHVLRRRLDEIAGQSEGAWQNILHRFCGFE